VTGGSRNFPKWPWLEYARRSRALQTTGICCSSTDPTPLADAITGPLSGDVAGGAEALTARWKVRRVWRLARWWSGEVSQGQEGGDSRYDRSEAPTTGGPLSSQSRPS
jgi:hypothetical protein